MTLRAAAATGRSSKQPNALQGAPPPFFFFPTVCLLALLWVDACLTN